MQNGALEEMFQACLNIVDFFLSFTLFYIAWLDIVDFCFTHSLWRCMTSFKGSLPARQTDIISNLDKYILQNWTNTLYNLH